MKKRAALFIFLVFIVTPVVAEETYILFDVKVEDHRKDDPVWLGVAVGSTLQHWRIEKHIFKVEPGKYRVDHIDFHESFKFGHGTLVVTKREEVEFEVRAGFINFLGTLNVKKKRGRMQLTYSAERSLVDLACQVSPEVFSEMEVIVALLPERQITHRVKCDS